MTGFWCQCRAITARSPDDAPAVRTLLRRRLAAESDLVVCGAAGDGAGALRLAAELVPDVLVLDWHLPNISGELLIALVAAACPDVRIRGV
jgi:DNA-binding NarL/FixJ family response regulator